MASTHETPFKEQIENSTCFICILPNEGELDEERNAQLDYAISLGKRVLILRRPGRELLAIPAQLENYDNYIVVDGSGEDAAKVVAQELEILPGDAIGIIRAAYC